MSQMAFLRQFDAMAFSALEDAGLADQAKYRSPGAASAVDCTVLIDRDVHDYGDDGAPVSVPYVRVVIQRLQVQPERGGVLAVGDVVYRLTDRINQDESVSRWVVEEVRT